MADTTRRRFLKGAVGGAVAATLIHQLPEVADAAPIDTEPDPERERETIYTVETIAGERKRFRVVGRELEDEETGERRIGDFGLERVD